METVFCECKKCDAPIGRFANLWTQIGKSYFSPAVEPEDDLAAQCRGEIRVGERGTLVEECRLQDIVCSGCAAVIGLKCVETPVNHVLDRDQIMLRLASIEFLNSNGKQIEFTIKRVLSVNEPSRVTAPSFPDPTPGGGFGPSAFPGAFELQQLRANLQSQRDDIKRIDNNGFKIVSALDKRVGRIEGEVIKLRGTLIDLRRDIGSVQKELGSLKDVIGETKQSIQDHSAQVAVENQLTSLSSTLGELGQQVTTLSDQLQREVPELRSELSHSQQEMEYLRSEVKDIVTSADHAQDVAALRAEMSQLRRELDEVRAKRDDRVETAFPPRELEILTSNIAKIGNRASQVETLQMELAILKGRVERTEASRQPSHAIDPRGFPVFPDMLAGMRKRASSPGLDSAPKNHTFSTGYSDLPERRYVTPPAWPVNPSISARREGLPGNDGSSSTANTGKRGRKPVRARTTTPKDDISMRLRKR